MVFPAASEAETVPERMETEKAQPLHNFSMPVFKWGSQRLFRCMKLNSNGEKPGGSPARRSPPSEAGSAGFSSPNRSGLRKPSTPSPAEKLRKPPLRPPAESADARIEEIRAKLVDHLHTAANQMRYQVPEEREEAESSRPWNLRTRRAVLKFPAVETGGGGGGGGGGSFSPPPPAAPENATRSRLRGSDAQIGEKKKKKKERFSIALSREEIEEDFFGITGLKPPRRPKKRAKNIQRQLDAVFPGLWLSDITPDDYKVDELPESGKR